MIMENKNYQKLELDKILLSVSNFAITDKGRLKILDTKPFKKVEEVRLLLDCTAECDKIL